MAANVGGADKVIRIVLGIALLAVGVFHVVTGGGPSRPTWLARYRWRQGCLGFARHGQFSE